MSNVFNPSDPSWSSEKITLPERSLSLMLKCAASFTYMLTVTFSCAGFGYTEKLSDALSSSSLQLDEKLCERVPLTPQLLLAVTFTLPAPVPQVASMLLLP